MANALERIGNRSAEIIEKLRLLKHGIGLAAGKSVARENKKRNPVCRCAAACRNHIGGSRSY